MEKGKNLHQLLLRTQKFTPKVCDSQQSQFFTPLFITLSTRFFTPVGNSLHQQCLYRLYIFPSLVTVFFCLALHLFPTLFVVRTARLFSTPPSCLAMLLLLTSWSWQVPTQTRSTWLVSLHWTWPRTRWR